jgi:hypothetical protein
MKDKDGRQHVVPLGRSAASLTKMISSLPKRQGSSRPAKAERSGSKSTQRGRGHVDDSAPARPTFGGTRAEQKYAGLSDSERGKWLGGEE